MCHSWLCLLTFSAVVVQIWAALDSGAMSRLCSRAITSAAMLFATCPLMNGRTGSVLGRRQRQFDRSVQNHRIKRSFSCQQDRHKKNQKGSLLTARLSLGALQILVERKAECRLRGLPGKLWIPLPANGSLCSLLFVPSGQATAALWIDSLYGWPHTHYQPRLCPLGCLSKSCSSFFCNDFTAATLQRKLPWKANVRSVWSLCSCKSAENTAKAPPGCVLVTDKFCLLLFSIYREIRDQFTAFNILKLTVQCLWSKSDQWVLLVHTLKNMSENRHEIWIQVCGLKFALLMCIKHLRKENIKGA